MNSGTMWQHCRADDKARRGVRSVQGEEPMCSQKQNQKLSESMGDSYLIYGMLPPMLHPRSEKIYGRRKGGI